MPNLEQLVNDLEASNSHPSYALEHLKDLAGRVDLVVKHISVVEQSFGGNLNEDEV